MSIDERRTNKQRYAPAVSGPAEQSREQAGRRADFADVLWPFDTLVSCLSKQGGLAERRDGIKDLSQRAVLSTNGLELDSLDSSVDEEPYDVLRLVAWEQLGLQGTKMRVGVCWMRVAAGNEESVVP